MVLYAGLQKAAHGFKAKVSDWGMLRELDTRGFASQQKYPCLSHLAPEVLLRGTISKVAPHSMLASWQAPGVSHIDDEVTSTMTDFALPLRLLWASRTLESGEA